jgi:hypothetical protein
LGPNSICHCHMLVELDTTKTFQGSIISHGLNLSDHGKAFREAFRYQRKLSKKYFFTLVSLMVCFSDEGQLETDDVVVVGSPSIHLRVQLGHFKVNFLFITMDGRLFKFNFVTSDLSKLLCR